MSMTSYVLVTLLFASTCDQLAGISVAPNLRRGQSQQSPAQPSPIGHLSFVEAQSNRSLLQASVALDKRGDHTLMRPHAGKGAEKISFALFAKNFYGDNAKESNFQIDTIIRLEWKDPRIVDLIPSDLDSMTISSDVARKKMWMPDVVVTNRDIDRYEILSSSVTLNRNGQAVKIERVHVKICEKFVLVDYPFDTEHFRVIIASSKYMLDDLVLVPDTRANSSGVDCKFGGYYIDGFELKSFEEIDGQLKKSRGMINIKATRNMEKYRQDHLVPTFIVLIISCAVFYFPMVGPFVVPRLALSVLCLLNFTNLMIKSGNALPGAAPFNWNDLLNQQVQFIMFLVIVTNIFAEICEHTFQAKWLAERINYEAMAFFPCFAAFDVSFVLLTGNYEFMKLRTATIVIQSITFLIGGCYAAWVIVMFVADKRTKEMIAKNADTPVLSSQMAFSTIVKRARSTAK